MFLAGDDDAFLAALSGLIARVVDDRTPELVHIVRVDNWFDHKWLRFSGKGRVPFDYGQLFADTALDEFTQDQLTFPPFAPNRIVEEVAFERVSPKGYRRCDAFRPTHARKRSHSSGNLHRRVAQFSSSGLFVWFSSHSTTSARASVMTYGVSEDGTVAWFASFRRQDDRWRVDRVKGTDRDEVSSWFPIVA